MIIPVKVYAVKGPDPLRTLTTNLKSLLQNYDFIEVPFDSNSTFDDVLYACAVKCEISPLYFPLFALWNPALPHPSWIKSGTNVASSDVPVGPLTEINQDKCIEFRIRFVVKTEMQVSGKKRLSKRYTTGEDAAKSFLDDKAVQYLYHQQREDFIQDRIKLKTDTEENGDIVGAALGVAVLDMLCMARAADVDVGKINKHVKFKRLLPISCQERLSRPNMNFCNRTRIKNKFRHYLEFFSPAAEKWQEGGRDITFFQRRYLLNLELLANSYGTEQYSLAVKGIIKVSADSGICLFGDESGEVQEKWCDFSELTDMSIQVSRNDNAESNTCIVSLSKLNGSVKTFALKSVSSAEDLASCIDGYYRLLVDPHHYLCREVCPNSLIERLRLGCHGSITCQFAENMLHQRVENGLAMAGDCVIRQAQEKYNEYFVNTICQLIPREERNDLPPLAEIRNFKLDRDKNGKLGLLGLSRSHQHDTLESLLQACKDSKYDGDPIPFSTSQIVFPKHKMKSNLVVRLCSADADDNDQNSNSFSLVPKTAIIMLKNYKFMQNLGNGCFTNVMKYAVVNQTNQYVVLKSVFEMNQKHDLAQKAHVDESFQESMTMLNQMKHEHIVQQIGMTLKNMVVLEYVPNQSITRYLQITQKEIGTGWSTWFLQVLWQLTHACNYLEELGFAHGNLCGKNILLWEDSDHPHIKLADPGVKTRWSSRNKCRAVEPILPVPWLACEFCLVDREPVYPKYPTINGDKWSFATTVCEILNWGRISMEPMNAYDLTEDLKHRYLAGKVLPIPDMLTENAELSTLIAKCWDREVDKRPPFQQILRELGSTLSSDYVLTTVSRRAPPNIIYTIEHDLPTFEDEKLTYHSCLGEGHFGSVDLFLYDQHRNGKTEKVAVKSLKRATNKLQILKDFNNEIETMRKLDHKYVVRLLGTTMPSGRIVMEYLPHGSLGDLLKKQKQRRGRALHHILLQFAAQIAEGMMALQEKRLIHRDLALRNILLADEPGGKQLHIKISDFGLSRILNEDTDFYVGNLDEFPAHWYAPECLCAESKKAFLFESDVWSFGVTVWEMFSFGEKPTYPPLPPITETRLLTQLQTHLKNGNRLPKTTECPDAVYDLMRRCWFYQPNERISFANLKDEFNNLIPLANRLTISN